MAQRGAALQDADTRPSAEERTAARPGGRSPVGLHVAVVAGYLVLSLFIWWHVWVTGHPTSSVTCLCGDPVEELWWLQWLPWAVLHGHNPLLSNALWTGTGGVNQLANGSSLLPDLVLSPVTLLFGPIAAFNVGALAAPVVSAWCMFVLCRRLTGFVPGQVLAGALWGFSPFVLYNLPHGHILHVLGVFEPLAALVVHDLLVEGRRRPWVNGVWLAVLVVAQFFTSTEMLVTSAMVGAVGLIVYLCLRRPAVWRRRRPVLVAAAWALALGVVVLAIPVWFALAGPRHFSGQPWPLNTVGQPVSGLVSTGPGIHQINAIQRLIGYTDPTPLPSYLGWWLLAFLAVSVPVWRRRALAWSVLVAGAFAWVLSWGIPDGSTHWWPWRLFDRLPLLSAVQPPRLDDLMYFCAALLLALSLDGWWSAIRRRFPDTPADDGGRRRRRRTGGALAVSALAVGALVPLVQSYTLPFAITPARIPGSGWYLHQAAVLPQGTRLLTLPFPSLIQTDFPMAFQARDSFRFALAGGYEIVPGAGGASNFVHPLPGTVTVLQDLTGGAFLGYPQPRIDSRTLTEVRRTLRHWGIQVTVITPYGNEAEALRFMTAVFGRPPVKQNGAWVWRGPPVSS